MPHWHTVYRCIKHESKLASSSIALKYWKADNLYVDDTMLNLSDSLTCQKQNKYGEGAFLVYRRRWRTKFTAETEKVHHTILSMARCCRWSI